MVSLQVQPIHESLADELAKIEGVDLSGGKPAYGVRLVQGLYQDRRVGIKAYDPPFASLKYTNLDIKDGDPTETGKEVFERDEPTALVSTNFMGHFGKKRGDVIEVPTPTGSHTFKVVGVIADYSASGGVIVMNRKWYREFWKDSTVSSFALRVKPGVDPEKVRLAIDQKLGPSFGLVPMLATELKRQVSELIDQSFNYTKAVQWAALLVGLLGFLNTLLISVIERFRELGMLRAVGMTQVQVFKLILFEALIQGIGGGFIAVLLGCYLAYLWITRSLSHTLGWIIDFHFPWTGVAQTLLLGVVAAIIAGCVPAIRSAKLQIREALQYD